MQDESGIVTAEVAFKKKKILFDSKFDLNLRGKKLVNCNISCITLYGAENWVGSFG
jgi:hypothetical protein